MSATTIESLQWRYATKKYDETKNVSAEDLATILEAGRLAPSSYGTEPWAFVVVPRGELSAKLVGAAYGQPQVGNASHVIVVCRRTDSATAIVDQLVERTAKTNGVPLEALDGMKNMVAGDLASRPEEAFMRHNEDQCYIALGTMIAAASELRVDNAALGGFVPAQVDEVLGLAEKGLASVVLLGIGYRASDDAQATRKKVRRDTSEVVITL
jgi:nitroreductase